MNETRRDKRAPVSLKVRFKSATLDEFREQYSIDISRGGLFIKSKQPMGVGTLLKFEFQLKDKSRLIHGVGRVVWVRPAEQSDDANPPGMGIKFIKMDPESRALVQEIVDGRGDQPGRFDEGTEDPEAEAADPAPAASMFPDLPPAELPPPEDRTAVRHASEFLASALATGDVGASAEAEQLAEEARQRAAARAATEIKLTGAVAEAARSGGKAPAAESTPSPAPSAVDPMASTLLAESPPAAKAEAPAVAATPAEPAVFPKATAAEPPGAPAPAERRGSPAAIFALFALLAGGALYGLYATGAFGESDEPAPASVAGAPAPSAPAEAPPVEAPPVEAPPTEAVAIAAEAAPSEPEVGEDVAPAPEPTPPPAARPVDVRVDSTPRGAEIRLGDRVLGETPATISLPEGVRASLVIDAPGHAAETVVVTPAERTPPVRATLRALPYVVHVESAPPGAIARVGSATTTTPGDLVLPRGQGNVILRVSLANHLVATEVFDRDVFAESGEAMRHSVTVTLTRAPARPQPGPRPAAEPGGQAPTPPAAGGEAPAPAPAEAAPAPAPAEAPAPAPAEAPAPAAPAPAPAAPAG